MANISNEALRSLCINMDWFTAGTASQYEKLFRLNGKPETELSELARIIWLCSDKNWDDEEEILDILKQNEPPFLEYGEFIKLARTHYNEGGDGYCECWDETTFSEYEREFHLINEYTALKMFEQSAAIENERLALMGPDFWD